MLPQIGIRRLRVHPLSILGDEVLSLLNLWLQCRGGPMTAARMPFAGGVGDQPARVMAIFGLMDQTAQDMSPPPQQ